MTKYRVFFSNDCLMWGVEKLITDYMGTRYVQVLPPRGKGGRKGQSAYTYYEGVAKRWLKDLENNLTTKGSK